MIVIRDSVMRSIEGEEPLYIYDREELRRMCRLFTGIPYGPKTVHFATMANSNASFLRVIKEEGLNVFVNSLSHLEAARDAGYSTDQIIFTASAMPRSLLTTLGDIGVKINLDSVRQIALWRELFPEAPFGIRCNVGDGVRPRKTTGGYFVGSESRLGLTTEEVRAMAGHPGVIGLHLYVGTNIMEVDYFLACYRSLLPLARLFPNLEYLDLGGGFGVPDDEEMDFSGIVNGRGFDFGAYGRTVTDLLSGFSKELGKPVRLVLEPGRIVGASCGYFACTVTDIKIRGGKQLIGVNASSAQFPRPLFYPEEARHPLRLIRDGRIVSAQVRLSAVFGCSTYSRDFLGRDLMLPDAGIGDVLLFGHAGAYCNAAHTSFLGFPRPREVFV